MSGTNTSPKEIPESLLKYRRILYISKEKNKKKNQEKKQREAIIISQLFLGGGLFITHHLSDTKKLIKNQICPSIKVLGKIISIHN